MVRFLKKEGDSLKNSKVKAASRMTQTADPFEREKTEFEIGLQTESAAKQKRFIALGLEQTSKRFSKVTDQVAKSDLWVRREPIPHGMELFPASSYLWYMRYSDLFYRHAEGGPLYLDTPGSAIEVAYCEQKLKAYRAKGIRYAYVKANEGALEVFERLDPPNLPQGAEH